MNLEAFKAVVTSKAARQILVAQKHSPKVLFIAGTVGVIGATVLACRATLKVGDALDQHAEDEQRIAARNADSEDACNKELRKLQLKTALDIAKPYLPAVGLGLVSIAALTGSHVILTKRNAGVMAAYAAVDRAFKEYRQRVATEFGEDTDRKFASGAGTVLVEEKTAEGKTKTTTKDVIGKDGKYASPYAVLFDEASTRWTREPGVNAIIVSTQQSYANDKLRVNGHVFLNEIYDSLGLPRTKAGAVVGWVHRRENEEKTGDNYISFGAFDRDLERGTAFVNGDEDSIWLDFNVDGVILDLI